CTPSSSGWTSPSPAAPSRWRRSCPRCGAVVSRRSRTTGSWATRPPLQPSRVVGCGRCWWPMPGGGAATGGPERTKGWSGRPAPPPVRLDRRTSILRRGAVVRILGGDPVTLVTPSPEAAALLDGGHGRTRVVGTDSPAGAALARALTDRGMAHPEVAVPEA